jgi:hypothetical protein
MENQLLIKIQNQTDLVITRQQTRNFLQNLQATTQEQARISWLTHNIARHILLLNRQGELILRKNTRQDDIGIQVICEGKWLLGIGSFYERQKIAIMEKSDEVVFREGETPYLEITIWLMGSEN